VAGFELDPSGWFYPILDIQVTDEHFARAAQNPTQHQAAYVSTGQSENLAASLETAETPLVAGAAATPMNCHLGDEGIEPSTAALRVRCSAN
jgi:glutamate/tyrosine decarboxylase-like PLP-dependent enzyme